MQRLKLLPVTIFSAVLVFIGCTKGDEGTQKQTQVTGSTNVTYSAWKTLQLTFSSIDSMYEQNIIADSLSPTILDSGVILTYIKYVDPSTKKIQIVNAGSYLEEVFDVNYITLSSTADFSGLGFMYILIPGSLKSDRLTSASSNVQGYTKAQWQSMTYNEVIAATRKR